MNGTSTRAAEPNAAHDLTVVLTGHREGCLAGPTMQSALVAMRHAEQAHALSIELIVVLDRADAATRAMLTGAGFPISRVIETDFGDPGQARNAGVAAATGTCVAFLDADDLWSYNWLSEGWTFASARPDAVGHCEMIMTFGMERNTWWHLDSEGPLYDPEYLRWANYWSALTFARTEIYRRFPFKANDLKLGFGHEDWHWNCMTIDAGIPHKPVLGTVHFTRRRRASQMSLVAQTGSIVWPKEIEMAEARRAARPGSN